MSTQHHKVMMKTVVCRRSGISLFLLWALCPFLWAAETGPPPGPADETEVYEQVMEFMTQHHAVPTMEQMAELPRGVPDREIRARLSARLYHEEGIMGGLLTEQEYQIVDYLFHERGRLGHLEDLAARIRLALGGGATILGIFDDLRFLRDAGYVEVHGRDQVYVVIPRGQKVLHTAPGQRSEGGLSDRATSNRSAQEAESPFPVDLPLSTSGGQGPKPETVSNSASISAPGQAVSRSPSSPSMSGALAKTEQTTPVAESTGMSMSPGRNKDRRTATALQAQWSVDARTTCASFSRGKTKSQSPESSAGIGASGGHHLRPPGPEPAQWPYPLSGNNCDLLVTTSDTYEQVRVRLEDGHLASCFTSDVVVFHGGQQGLHFFRTLENFRLWKQDHAGIPGTTMTMEEAVSRASRLAGGR